MLDPIKKVVVAAASLRPSFRSYVTAVLAWGAVICAWDLASRVDELNQTGAHTQSDARRVYTSPVIESTGDRL